MLSSKRTDTSIPAPPNDHEFTGEETVTLNVGGKPKTMTLLDLKAVLDSFEPEEP